MTLLEMRRELQCFLMRRSALLLGAGFFFVHGLLLTLLVVAGNGETLGVAPARVQQLFFGGSVLHWVVSAVFLSSLGMGTIARQRSQKSFEFFQSLPVSARSRVIGGFLSVAFLNAIWWLSALLPLWVVSSVGVGEAKILWPAALSGVAGLIFIGTCLSAISMYFSATSYDQTSAALSAFSTILVWLALGEIAEAGWLLDLDSPFWSLRSIAEGFSRGIWQGAGVLLLLGITIAALLSATSRLSVSKDGGVARQLNAGLSLALFLGLALLAKQRGWSWTIDSGSGISTELKTLAADYGEELGVELQLPDDQRYDSVARDLRVFLSELQTSNPKIRVSLESKASYTETILDWAKGRTLDALAAEREQSLSGSLVVKGAGQAQRIALSELTQLSDSLSVGPLSLARSEEWLGKVLMNGLGKKRNICLTSGHGESAPSDPEEERRWTGIYQRLLDAGLSVRSLEGLRSEALEACAILMVVAPKIALSESEIFSLEKFFVDGGSGFILLSARHETKSAAELHKGLNSVLSKFDIEITAERIVSGGGEQGWATKNNSNHPVSRVLGNSYATQWPDPISLLARGPKAQALVFAPSMVARGDSSLGDASVLGVPAIAAQDGVARVVLWGAAENVSDRHSAMGSAANQWLALSAISWLLHKEEAPMSSAPPLGLRFSGRGLVGVAMALTIGWPAIWLAFVLLWRRFGWPLV